MLMLSCYYDDDRWAFYMAMGNHLRINNDSTFLYSRAANSSLTVAEALETIVTDFEEYLIPGTHLVVRVSESIRNQVCS